MVMLKGWGNDHVLHVGMLLEIIQFNVQWMGSQAVFRCGLAGQS